MVIKLEKRKKPRVLIAGRTNVGKSSFFNRLVRRRAALVYDRPGVTRDLREESISLDSGRKIILVDSPGLSQVVDTDILKQAESRVAIGLKEMDLLLFMLDAKDGVLPEDKELYFNLKALGLNPIVVLNKIDFKEKSLNKSEVYKLGIDEFYMISATHGKGVKELQQKIEDELAKSFEIEEESEEISEEEIKSVNQTLKYVKVPDNLNICIVGKPNVGKSSLLNKLIDSDRCTVSSMPGTTVDDVEVRWNLGNKHAFLLDTAGLRRKAKVKDPVEKISALRSLSVIDRSHMVLAVISVEDEIADQDIRVIKYAIDAGKAILVLLNKTDLVSKKDLKEFEAEIIYRLDDATYVPFHFISAKKGIGIAKITDLVKKLEREIHRNHDTKIVNHHLKIAQERHHLPAAQGTLRSKIYYGCQVGYFPKKILVFAKRPDWIPESYRRYVQNFFRKALKIKYLPLEVEFRKRQSIYKKNKK